MGTNWIYGIVFLFGIYFGGIGAWLFQDARLSALTDQYNDFAIKVKQDGDAAKQKNDKIAAENKLKQQKADDAYQTNIATLHTTIKRLQNARSRSSFLPPAAPHSASPDVACFNRTELERTLQQLDGEIQELITSGDEAIIELNNARGWVKAVY